MAWQGEAVEVEGGSGGRGWEYPSGNAFVVWASTSTKIQQILQSTALGKPAETRSLTAERVATLLAQLKEKQELREKSKQSICPAMFKGSRRNCTVLAAPQHLLTGRTARIAMHCS